MMITLDENLSLGKPEKAGADEKDKVFIGVSQKNYKMLFGLCARVYDA